MKRRISKALNLICFFAYNRIAAVFLKLKDKKVLFLSESHQSLDGNLKAVWDDLDDSYEKIARITPDRRQEIGLLDKLRLWKDLTDARYIILDDFYGLTSAMRLRKGQELVQLWHGCGAFKKFGFSRRQTGDNIQNVNSGYRKYTKVSVTSEQVRPCFAEAFDIPAERVKAMGSPRTDMFFDEEKMKAARKRVYEALPQIQGKKVVLIAPTYRGRKVEDACYDFEKLDLSGLCRRLGSGYHIITKWHPALYNNIKRGIAENPFGKKWELGQADEPSDSEDCAGITDASGYGDINDLLTAADVLVTDYSSVIFDWSLLDKPIVYFVYDIDQYQDSRGLYFDFEDYVYGTCVRDGSLLAQAIEEGGMQLEKRDAFNQKFMSSCDGHSTERVINWVFRGEDK